MNPWATIAATGLAAFSVATPPRPHRIASVTILHYEAEGGRFKKRHREVKTFNRDGKITADRYYTPRGKLHLVWRYYYDRRKDLVRMTYREPRTGRRIRRTYRYRYDAKGRLVERIMKAPELKTTFRSVYAYRPNGAYSVQEYRKHRSDPNEYRDGSKVFNAAGKRTRSCSSTMCSMYEYDRRGNVRRVRSQFRGHHSYRVYRNTYDPAGRLVRVKVGGIVRKITYNKQGDPVLEIKTLAGKPSEKKVYTYKYRY